MTLKGLSPEKVQQEYKRLFYEKAKEIRPEIETQSLDLFWSKFNSFGFIEISLDNISQQMDIYVRTFCLLEECDVFKQKLQQD